jgi:hypothetical protein
MFGEGPFVRELRIRALGLSALELYPQSMILNGEKFKASLISHDQLAGA